MKKGIDCVEAGQICARHGIEIRTLEAITGSFDKKIFVINGELLLRVSETTMAPEQEKFRRVAALRFVPRIQQTGVLEREAGPIYYTLLTCLPGDDFVNAYSETTVAQQRQLGREVAAFLDDLHAIPGTAYDIGLYVPAIPNFAGTWREGHQQYWALLKEGSKALELEPDSALPLKPDSALPLKPGSVGVFERAFRFLDASVDVLEFQTGPRLLHNDFHPKNILLHRGRFSGVIDWECSQFGEADFELCHVVHWCVYPPRPDIDFVPFLGALFQSSPKCAQVPDLARRLTIYQIEHEIQQILWQGGRAEAERVPRIVQWMDGGVDDLLGQIC